MLVITFPFSILWAEDPLPESQVESRGFSDTIQLWISKQQGIHRRAPGPEQVQTQGSFNDPIPTGLSSIQKELIVIEPMQVIQR